MTLALFLHPILYPILILHESLYPILYQTYTPPYSSPYTHRISHPTSHPLSNPIPSLTPTTHPPSPPPIQSALPPTPYLPYTTHHSHLADASITLCEYITRGAPQQHRYSVRVDRDQSETDANYCHRAHVVQEIFRTEATYQVNLASLVTVGTS